MLAHAHASRGTILDLGQRGVGPGGAFVLAGRTAVRGAHGAIWNEWTLRHERSGSAFLVEAAGRFVLYEEASLVPAWEDVVLGAPIGADWIVVERGVAERVGAWGDVAEAPAAYRYVDLSSRTGASASIDFDAPLPRIFAGARTTLAALGLAPARAHPRLVPTAELSRPSSVSLWLEPGDEGELDVPGSAPCRVRVLGVVARSADETRWEEYLLHDAVHGLRWLVVEGAAFSLATSVEAGLVELREGGARLGGVAYAARSAGTARVEWLAGELPWEAAAGETTSLAYFEAEDGASLTKESTDDGLAWTRAEPIATELVAKAFGRRALPR